MDILVEILFWPIGGVLCDALAGLWGILEREGKPVRAPRALGPCSYCRRLGRALVKCAVCSAPHHRDCATVNGRCAVYGCANRKFLVPAA